MYYLVSDIHGCYYSFENLLKKIKLKEKDTLICIGDAIDRGKHSFKVLDLFMERDNFQLIKGNHEYFYEMFFNNHLSAKTWWKFGGMDTINELRDMGTDDKLKYYNYIIKLPLYITKGDYCLVHSGLSGDLSIIEDDDYVINVCETIETQYEEDAFNYMVSGDIHYMPKQDFDKQIIVGHLPTFKINNKPRILYGKNCIDIDCGASYSKGRLGCLRLDDMKEFYVPIDKRDV